MLKWSLTIITLVVSLSTGCYAEDSTPAKTTDSATTDTPEVITTTVMTADGPITLLTMQCPAADQLQYDEKKMTWSTSNGFKSFNTSFVKTIKSFNGAQWNGAGLGQIFCIYYGANEFSFPIMLAYNIMTLEPQKKEGLSWTENLGGYYNCVSHDPAQCPFQVRARPKKQTLLEELEGLKSGSPDNTPTF